MGYELSFGAYSGDEDVLAILELRALRNLDCTVSTIFERKADSGIATGSSWAVGSIPNDHRHSDIPEIGGE